MKVKVDRDKCMGHAVCALMAPGLMKLDDLGYNVTGIADVAPAQEEEARRAAGACPEGAIEIIGTEP
jgi:ferredoxin